jgi:hypothetical protein
MDVKQVLFLVFPCLDVPNNFGEPSNFGHSFKKGFHLQLKYVGDRIWLVKGCLVGFELCDYFLPIRVASECEEDIQNSFAPHNSHCILICLHHETWTTANTFPFGFQRGHFLLSFWHFTRFNPKSLFEMLASAIWQKKQPLL